MSQYLGDISAYALAVSQGYTGTEEEYAELMANYATVGQTAVTAAQTATTKASEAATSATTATNKASEATTAAQTATTKAGEASTSATTATTAKDTAVSAASTATTKATEATTAAATATSAATTATAAKDDAVSAKTAAQTAQTGAETAAASVQSSAAQIQTNADDISELKEDLSEVYPVSVLLDKSKYSMTDIKSIRKTMTSAATWQTDTWILFENVAVSEGQTIRLMVRSRSINGVATTIYAQIQFKNSNDENISMINITYGTDGVDLSTGACNYNAVAPTGASKMTVVFFGVANYAPVVGTDVYINGACVIVGDVELSNVEALKSYADDLTKKVYFNNGWRMGGYYANGYGLENDRICTDSIKISPIPFMVDIADGYKYGVSVYDNNDVRVSDTGWLTGPHTVESGVRYGITIKRVDNVAPSSLEEFYNAITFYSAFGASNEADETYYYYGEKIETQKHALSFENLGVTRTQPQESVIMEGGAIYGGKLFQAYHANFMQVYDIATNTLENSFAITCDHGDCVDFSNEFYDSNDLYPLMYLTADTTPMKVYVNRVNDGVATLIRTLVFPLDTGHYGGHALDADNNIIYTIGYSEADFRTSANNNHMIIKSWDLSTLTDNNDGTHTPKLIDTFVLPFIYCCQDQTFFDGKIFVISSFLSSESPSKIVVIDPIRKSIVNNISAIPVNLIGAENEVITFMLEDYEYKMVIGNFSNYFKVTLR